MAIGAGKYEAECTKLLQELQADVVMVIVVGGSRGQGFSLCVTNPDLLDTVAVGLRHIASQVEADARRLRQPGAGKPN